MAISHFRNCGFYVMGKSKKKIVLPKKAPKYFAKTSSSIAKKQLL
jgi:hypothetical protein